MIQFFYENLPETVNSAYKFWLEDIILSEGKKLGEINYIFCDDEYLLKVNQDYLQHDYYTDIITFDYVKGRTISGEIFVSLQRISDNASTLSRDYEEELRRVLAHGVLHLSGYKDKTEEEEQLMRSKEDYYLAKYSK
ncbi:rRNA maturation RNase YbeY [Chryseobacterium taichungense]|uniref:Endoribonuclease YbeY n=1 Tax=Chryseobacterium taichungense TaxID=295069 RepID=A0A1H8CT95_9FLAO|nr:rRNA maturation RNase YbeY [Chryseobacterium taichungense]SEM98363.1 rRNA maturation RNase YbeY [Chryseobacterium taichungense]